MTENELRRKVCEQAEYWLGRKESDGSHRVIIDVYNAIPLPGGYKLSYTDPWCAGFVSAVGAACGLSDIIFPDCNCDAMINKYRAAGRWMENDAYLPKCGDVIFYDWDDSGAGDNVGSSDHVGLVLSVTGESVSVIEGNCSDMVKIRTIQRNGRFIRGYGLPDYAKKATDVGPGEDAEEESEDFPFPTIQIGEKGEVVRAAQLLLIGRGFSCGFWGADGDFGTGTEKAVGKFQKAYGLECDGVIGPETWTALITGRAKK